jgi:two-component system response regulator FixJ
LIKRQIGLPVIIVTGHGDAALAVRAIQAGGGFQREAIRRAVDAWVEYLRFPKRAAARPHPRQRLRAAPSCSPFASGKWSSIWSRANKVIAYELDISPRTVEIHRAHLMEKMQARSLSDLIQLAFAAVVVPAACKEVVREASLFR